LLHVLARPRQSSTGGDSLPSTGNSHTNCAMALTRSDLTDHASGM
jgi:hypothetical protein